jgi:hypothetical protein
MKKWKDIVEKAKTYKLWGCRACIRSKKKEKSNLIGCNFQLKPFL